MFFWAQFVHSIKYLSICCEVAVCLDNASKKSEDKINIITDDDSYHAGNEKVSESVCGRGGSSK